MKVLWIDDDNYQTKILKEEFNLFGWNIEFFSKYEKGLQKIMKYPNQYDAIMLDIMMPPGKLYDVHSNQNGSITGLLLYKDIRKYYSGPILIYSVVRNINLIEKYLKNDSKTGWLNKPLIIEDIINKIRELM